MILLCKFPENLGQLCIRVKVLPCLRGESHIDFRTHCVTMTVVGGGWGGDGASLMTFGKSEKLSSLKGHVL